MLNVQQRAESLGTYRWIAVKVMRQLAEWIPTTPEMEVKVLFGRHVWDCARHADAFGKRAFELRAPLHFTLAPPDAYQEWLRDLASAGPTADRVAAIYDVALPAIERRYRGYLGSTDPLMDEPSVRILESALSDFARMRSERERLLQGVALGRPTLDTSAACDREAAIPGVAFGEHARARGGRA